MNAPFIFRRNDRGVYSAEASDLGLAPGAWPEYIEAQLGQGRLVRARLLTLHRDSGREITHAEYAPFGAKCRILIWND